MPRRTVVGSNEVPTTTLATRTRWRHAAAADAGSLAPTDAAAEGGRGTGGDTTTGVRRGGGHDELLDLYGLFDDLSFDDLGGLVGGLVGGGSAAPYGARGTIYAPDDGTRALASSHGGDAAVTGKLARGNAHEDEASVVGSLLNGTDGDVDVGSPAAAKAQARAFAGSWAGDMCAHETRCRVVAVA